MYSLIRPFLLLLPAETAHHLALNILNVLPFKKKRVEAPKEVCGITFPNPVGIAAGLDKNGEYLKGLSKLGVGFIEIGTVTPRPQTGNPKPRLFRALKDKAILNRMGFNNAGVDAVIQNLKKASFTGVLGINIGKNKDTPLEKAVDDYLYCLERLGPYATYVTLNISSPNTPDLRQLQNKGYLQVLLEKIVIKRDEQQHLLAKKLPLFIKLSPDESEERLKETIEVINQSGVDGIIATNTTVEKSSLSDKALQKEQGGVSGALLFHRANQTLSFIRAHSDLPIIGVGGIMSAEDGKEKVRLGADLIQIYSGLIYQGPGLLSSML